MPRSFRALIEALLPWYDGARERRRDAQVNRLARHSAIARLRAARIIHEYRLADGKSNAADTLAAIAEAERDIAIERVIDEVPR
jgi:hypothetical protein